MAIALSVLPRSTTSDYPLDFLWPLYCLSFLDLRLMITHLVSCGHCIVCPSSIYDFWLPLWYLVAIVLSVLPRFTTFDYPFGILWPLYCLSFLDLRLLITPLVSCGHCIVGPSSIYDFWLPLWYHVAIVLSVLPRFTTFDYPFGILWPLYCLSVLDLRLLIIPFVSCGHCIVFPSSIYDFWLPLWYLLAVVLSVLSRLTTSDYPFGILWPLYFLSFLDLRLLITPLVSCGHCIVCHTSILFCPSFLDLRLWLLLWYHVAIVLSVLPRFTTYDYPFRIFWPLYCLSLLDLRLLITSLVSCGHCIVCPSSIYDFWILLWYLVAIVFSVLPRFTISVYPFGILWPLYCLSFLDLRLLINSFCILWPLYCLSLLELRLLIIPFVSCGHCIVFPTSIYDFWLPLWYLVAVVLSVLPRLTTSDCPFGILWPLYFLSFLDLRLLITPFVSCGHCIVFPSSIYDFWLPLWYLVAVVLSVLPRFTTSDYPFGILWPLYFLSFLDLRLLIIPFVSCGHCIVFLSSIYDFWLPLWYLVAVVLSVLPRFTTSDYPFGILWPLYCLSFLDFVLSIIPRFCIVCHSSIYDFWLPLWYLVAIALSVLLDLRLLITPLVSCSHRIVCPSSIYDFWLPLWYLVAIVLSVILRFGIVCHSSINDLWLPFWYLVAIVLSVLPRFTTSDYPFWYLVAIVLSFPPRFTTSNYPFWYLVAIVLSFPPRFTTSDYPVCILWPLYCLSLLDLRLLIIPFVSCGHCIVFHLLDLRLLITPLVSCGRCIVCPSSINVFWLPLWYLVAIVFSILPRFTTSDYPFGILWPLYYLSFIDFVLSVIPRFCIVCPSSIYD